VPASQSILRLGERLGKSRACDIRKFLKQNKKELEGLAALRTGFAKGEGRTAEEYWLNEAQPGRSQRQNRLPVPTGSAKFNT
jgi:hypothetical protein